MKYIGYSRKAMFGLVDNALTGNDNNSYHQILDKIDPYHIVRFLIEKDTPVMYTLATKQAIAVERFMYVLDPLMLNQENEGIRNKYDKDLLKDMLEHNVRSANTITWETNYKSENYQYLGEVDIGDLEGIPIELDDSEATKDSDTNE